MFEFSHAVAKLCTEHRLSQRDAHWIEERS